MKKKLENTNDQFQELKSILEILSIFIINKNILMKNLFAKKCNQVDKVNKFFGKRWHMPLDMY